MQLPCFQSIEQGGQSDAIDKEAVLPRTFRVAAWNLERCLDVAGSAHLLAAQCPEVILLSEMDNGMARTAQQHTTQQLAEQLGMHYCYGLEFLELDLGNEADCQFAVDNFNEKAFMEMLF